MTPRGGQQQPGASAWRYSVQCICHKRSRLRFQTSGSSSILSDQRMGRHCLGTQPGKRTADSRRDLLRVVPGQPKISSSKQPALTICRTALSRKLARSKACLWHRPAGFLPCQLAASTYCTCKKKYKVLLQYLIIPRWICALNKASRPRWRCQVTSAKLWQKRHIVKYKTGLQAPFIFCLLFCQHIC